MLVSSLCLAPLSQGEDSNWLIEPEAGKRLIICVTSVRKERPGFPACLSVLHTMKERALLFEIRRPKDLFLALPLIIVWPWPSYCISLDFSYLLHKYFSWVVKKRIGLTVWPIVLRDKGGLCGKGFRRRRGSILSGSVTLGVHLRSVWKGSQEGPTYNKMQTYYHGLQGLTWFGYCLLLIII